MSKRLFGIRGAVCCENTEEAIQRAVGDMCSRVFGANNLKAEDIVSVQFTMTADLDALNPAAALRRSSCGGIAGTCALFCSSEPYVRGGLDHVVRLLVTAYMEEGARPVHLYTGGAEVLRPDFCASSEM